MSGACPELHELLDLEKHPAGDTARRHIDECPRCRNRLALYSSFLEPTGVPVGADVADAERRLGESFDHARHAEATDPLVERTASVPSASRTSKQETRSWLDFVLAPRAAWALAAVLLVGAIALMRPWSLGPPGTGTLRRETSKEQALLLDAPAATANGGLKLSWSRHPEADAYRIQILGPDLTELLKREVAETSVELGPSEVPGAPGVVLGWKVTALRAGAEVSSSPMGTIRRP